MCDQICMFAILVGFILTAIQVDVQYNKSNNTQNSILLILGSVQTIFLSFNFFFFNSFLVIFTIIKYNQKILLDIAQIRLPVNCGIKDSGYLSEIAFSLIILIPHPIIFLKEKNISYYYNEMLSLYQLARVALIFQSYLNQTLYRNQRAFRICKMYLCKNSYTYAMRALFKSSPIKLLIILLIFSLCVFGFALRICERPLEKGTDNNPAYSSYYNSFWIVIVTFTSVGYGDYYPKTLLGRSVTFILSLWGVFLTSFIVVTLINILELTSSEFKTQHLILRLNKRIEMKIQASQAIVNLANIKVLKKKTKYTKFQKEELDKYQKQLTNNLKTVRKLSRQIKSMIDTANHEELISNHYIKVKHELEEIQNEQQFLINMNKKIMKKVGIQQKLLK